MKGETYMTNLKQEDLARALIQLVNVRYLIGDGYHTNEVVNIIKVIRTLFDELDDDVRRAFLIWLDEKMKKEGSE